MTDVAERLNPPPRDFTFAQYKIKTTDFENDYPNDDDLFRMIRDGMPGTAMPGWSDVLADQQIWDLVAYIKTFAGLEEEEPGPAMDYGKQVESSVESIEQGKKLFLEDDRCTECHGQAGRGDAIKGLKDDAGYRTWPRNLTKPWTFRLGSVCCHRGSSTASGSFPSTFSAFTTVFSGWTISWTLAREFT